MSGKKVRGRAKGYREVIFYEPVAKWLKSQGYQVLIAAATVQVILPLGSLLGVQFLKPDIVGYKKDEYKEIIASVEIKIDPMQIYDGIGKCVILQQVSDYVYLALPEEYASKVGPGSFFEDLSIGLLGVQTDGQVTVHVEAKEVPPHKKYSLRQTFLGMVKSALGVPWE